MNDAVTRTELLLPGPAQALGGLLDVPVPDLDTDGLPLLWHWIYLLDRPRQADLGPVGHPVRGALPAPPGPARRRMWAGGRVRTSARLRCGQTATRRSRVLSMGSLLPSSPRRRGPAAHCRIGRMRQAASRPASADGTTQPARTSRRTFSPTSRALIPAP